MPIVVANVPPTRYRARKFNKENPIRPFHSACLAFAIALVAAACDSGDDPEIDPSHLVGAWVNTHKDGREVPTDDRFVSIYLPAGKETYAIRGPANHWTETAGYSYAVGGETIAVAGHGTQLEYELLELSPSTLEYRVSRLVVNGQDLRDTAVYVLRKVQKDYSAQLLGLWEGRETTDGASGAVRRWKYNADGSYQYFHEQVGGRWLDKSDNSGKWFLYGDHFVSNYRNDANSGVAGNACEAWTISIDGDSMRWKALRGGKTRTFSMVRVAQ